MNRGILCFLALAALVLTMPARDAEARSTIAEPSSPTASVVVALVDELDGGPGVSAVVIRRAAADPSDVILLRRRDADGARLASAVAMLMLQRTTEQRAARDVRTRISGAAVPASWRSHWLPRFESVVARLQRADAKPLAGIGTVPSETLVLPPRDADRE